MRRRLQDWLRRSTQTRLEQDAIRSTIASAFSGQSFTDRAVFLKALNKALKAKGIKRCMNHSFWALHSPLLFVQIGPRIGSRDWTFRV